MSMQALKEAVNSAKRDTFSDGTVIRWLQAERYHYAAIKSPVGWYTTVSDRGTAYVPKVTDFDGLLEVLTRPDVKNVQVAAENGWVDVADSPTSPPPLAPVASTPTASAPPIPAEDVPVGWTGSA